MWMTREEIADYLGIVVNSVRGKVQKGQIERKVEGGKNLYRIVDPKLVHFKSSKAGEKKAKASDEVKEPPRVVGEEVPPRPVRVSPPPVQPVIEPGPPKPFNPKQRLLEELASMKIGRSIDAIEKGDEIDLATGEISRELEARLSMRQQKQLKEIQDALERLKAGYYGECEECGEPIPEQRLKLFPAARLCVRCQEEADQLEKMRQEQGLRGANWKEDATEGGYGKFFEE
ncbi:MAG: TraR/DksA family transcriptional regulator [Desulfomonile sp.]|nr:TraR/DksA family transcriptional regulator [Desulfomonile sp.]